MKRKHAKTLERIFHRPVSGNVQWREVVALLQALGAEISEREGSRIAVSLRGKDLVLHRPHPSPNLDKGAVTSLREFLQLCGIAPEN